MPLDIVNTCILSLLSIILLVILITICAIYRRWTRFFNLWTYNKDLQWVILITYMYIFYFQSFCCKWNQQTSIFGGLMTGGTSGQHCHIFYSMTYHLLCVWMWLISGRFLVWQQQIYPVSRNCVHIVKLEISLLYWVYSVSISLHSVIFSMGNY